MASLPQLPEDRARLLRIADLEFEIEREQILTKHTYDLKWHTHTPDSAILPSNMFALLVDQTLTLGTLECRAYLDVPSENWDLNDVLVTVCRERLKKANQCLNEMGERIIAVLSTNEQVVLRQNIANDALSLQNVIDEGLSPYRTAALCWVRHQLEQRISQTDEAQVVPNLPDYRALHIAGLDDFEAIFVERFPDIKLKAQLPCRKRDPAPEVPATMQGDQFAQEHPPESVAVADCSETAGGYGPTMPASAPDPPGDSYGAIGVERREANAKCRLDGRVRGKADEQRIGLQTAAASERKEATSALTGEIGMPSVNAYLVDAKAPSGECLSVSLEPGSEHAVALYLRADKASPLSAAEDEKPNHFRKHVETWELTFGGKTDHVGNVIGFGYIADLLRVPNRPISAADLCHATRPDSQIAERAMPVADAKTIRQVKDVLKKCQAELLELDASEWEAHKKLDRDIKQCESYLAKSRGVSSRARLVGGINEKCRTKVTNSISRAIKKISKINPELGRHLHDSITTGTELVYRQTSFQDWQL